MFFELVSACFSLQKIRFIIFEFFLLLQKIRSILLSWIIDSFSLNICAMPIFREESNGWIRRLCHGGLLDFTLLLEFEILTWWSRVPRTDCVAFDRRWWVPLRWTRFRHEVIIPPNTSIWCKSLKEERIWRIWIGRDGILHSLWRWFRPHQVNTLKCLPCLEISVEMSF